MRIPIVCHGDETTTRGKVVALTATIHDDGRKIALFGDQATCGDCKGLWNILGTGQGMGENGRVAVVNGDRVLCPCGRNRVIASADAGMFIHLDTGSPVSQERATDAVEFHYDEQVHAVATCVSIAGYPYCIETTSGEVYSGRVDSGGLLPRIATDQVNSYAVYWGDEALAHKEFI
jgi:uncharacterized Zn-binding protein involved in type VI secretion